MPFINLSPGLREIRFGTPRTALLATTVAGAAWLVVNFILQPRKMKNLSVPSPGTTVLPRLRDNEIADIPYPPDALPGGRDVVTPYGSIRVYEWGPEEGEKVLFIHGISTPVIAIGDLGHEFANRGYRVMLFGNSHLQYSCRREVSRKVRFY